MYSMSVYFMCSLCVHGYAIMLFGLCEGKPIDNHHHISVLLSDGINTILKLCNSTDFDLLSSDHIEPVYH